MATNKMWQTVSEYVAQNPGKASYIIKKKRKKFLCRQEEATSLFGQSIVVRIRYRNNNKNLPILIVKRKA